MSVFPFHAFSNTLHLVNKGLIDIGRTAVMVTFKDSSQSGIESLKRLLGQETGVL